MRDQLESILKKPTITEPVSLRGLQGFMLTNEDRTVMNFVQTSSAFPIAAIRFFEFLDNLEVKRFGACTQCGSFFYDWRNRGKKVCGGKCKSAVDSKRTLAKRKADPKLAKKHRESMKEYNKQK